MTSGVEVADRFRRCLGRSATGTEPFRHWLLEQALPEAAVTEIVSLPLPAPQIAETLGKRETNNSQRLFFGTETRNAFPVCAALTEAFQDAETVSRLSERCSVDLSGSYLRIEYCQDTEGFWLEPHTDIGAKLFTMLIYLSDEAGSEDWGTDLLSSDRTLVCTVPYQANCGLIFVPGEDTWHGFHKRPISGIRRSIIVNYVKPEWRARHELAFPETPV